MAGRAAPVARERVALFAQLGLGQAGAVELDDLRAERLGAEARVGRGVVGPQRVVHVQGRDAIPERAERVPHAGRGGAAGDETADLAAGLDQLVAADALLDPLTHRAHGALVTLLV